MTTQRLMDFILGTIVGFVAALVVYGVFFWFVALRLSQL